MAGLSQGMSLRDIAEKHSKKLNKSVDEVLSILKDEIKKGIKVEKEHTNDSSEAAKIARDHLVEDPNYYSKLSKLSLEERKRIRNKAKYYFPYFGYNDNNDNDHSDTNSMEFDGGVFGENENPFIKTLDNILESIVGELGVSEPKINLINDPNFALKHNSYACYDPNEREIYVSIHLRTLADVSRSCIHELYHHFQNEKGQLGENSGEDGDRWENEANSFAGKKMRQIGRDNPQIFSMTYDN